MTLVHDPIGPLVDRRLREAGHAAGLLAKSAAAPSPAYSLAGRLVASDSGWGLLTVPNALVRGLFDAMDEPGVELPPNRSGTLNAHISVFTKEDMAAIGGPGMLTERGHTFRYNIGPIKTVRPAGWAEMSAVYFVEVRSPALEKLRKSYGLTPLPHGDHPFHITVCVRRKHVLRDNAVSKAAEARGPEDEYCPRCDARLERDPYSGKCNGCGAPWPEKAAANTVTRTSTRGDTTYDIDALIARMADRTPETLPLADFKVNRSSSTGFSRKRLEAADPAFPGIVDTDGTLLDGKHRTARLQDAGATHGRYHRATPADIAAVAKAAAADHKHFRARCRCGAVVAQCRCDAAAKREFTTARVCDACREKSAVDWKGLATEARRQLPGFHLPEAALGGVVGGLGGAAIGALRGPTDGKSTGRRMLEHAALGAGLGAVGGTVLGDRARRYVSNSVIPWAYDADPKEALRPKSWQHVWDAAIRDRPAYAASEPGRYNDLLAGSGYRARTLHDYFVPARRELLRRTLGVHADDATADFWAKDPASGSYGINPGRPDVDEVARRFAGNAAAPLRPQHLQDPGQLVDSINGAQDTGHLLGAAAVGHQRIEASPGPGGALAAHVRDRWDFDLHPDERGRFRDGVSALLSGRRPDPGWAGLAGRAFLDHAVSHEKPTIDQRMRFVPGEHGWDQHSLQFLGEDGKPIGAAVKAGAVDYGDPAKLPQGLVDFIVQHHARKGNHHHDVRLGTPALGLLSWATRKGLPAPGDRRPTALYQTPVHAHAYGQFEGTLRGGDVVRRVEAGKAEIHHASPRKIDMTLVHRDPQERLRFVRPGNMGPTTWLARNTTEVTPNRRQPGS